MSEGKPEDNPIRARLSPAQFNASVKFYKADNVLSNEDRSEIADDLQTILYKTSIMGYSSAMVAFFAPTIYNRFYKKTPRIIGVPNLSPFVYKPFMSFFIGLTTLMVVHQQGAKYYFHQKKDQLQGVPAKVHQYDVWDAIDYHQCGLFYLYYKRTATDASYKIDDPRTYTNEKLHQIRYHPPHVAQIQQNHGQLSSWDQVRVQNGFGINESKPVESGITQNENDLFQTSDGETREDANSPDSVTTQTKSKWDEIRNK